MKEYVVYTIMVGQYGDVRQPIHIDNRFDYVLFSNNFKEDNIGVWKVRTFPQPEEIAVGDNKRLSRYPKSHPETLLAEYEASLYIDANIQIADQWVYDRVIALTEQKVEYAGVKLLLTGSDCIYRHSYDMCVVRAENDYNAIEQMHALYKKGFPEHFRLNENNIIYRRHSNRMKVVDEEWWHWIVNYSFRDQFSYMYCLWKYEMPIIYFLPEGEDSHNSTHFVFTHHNENPEVAKRKWVKVGFFEKFRNKCRGMNYEKYREQWVSLCKMSFPTFWLFLWGIVILCINLPQIFVRKLKKLL